MQDPEFALIFERNIESFHLVNKTGAKRISYGYHGNAS